MARTILSGMIVLSVLVGSATGVTIQVPANIPYPYWFDTSISLSEGQSLDISASGSWSGNGVEQHGPEGFGPAPGVFLVPGAPAGGLVGRIGTGTGFGVGLGGRFDASTYGIGTLYLAFNDEVGGYSDNAGSVTVTITVGGTPPQTVTIRGVVYYDATNQPLADARVEVENRQQSMETDANGQYEIIGVAAGGISVKASKANYGYSKKTVEAIEPGQLYTVDFRLHPDIRCDFTPAQNGFSFPNTIGVCTGFTYTALRYYLSNVEPPPHEWPILLEIMEKHLAFNGLLLTNGKLIEVFLYSAGGGSWVEPNIEQIRSSLASNLPCPLILPASDIIGIVGGQHSVLAYKLTENWDNNSRIYGISVYDSTQKPSYDDTISVYHQNGGWKMTPYGRYTRFGATPFTGAIEDLVKMKWAALKWAAFSIHSPATIRVVDPDGLVVDHDRPQVQDGYYWSIDIDGDNDQEDLAFFVNRKSGIYTVQVIPDPGASPTDTYSLEVESNGNSLTVAQDVPIGTTPRQPYLILSTESGLQVVTAQAVGSLVSVTVGRAAFDAKTKQFSANVTVTNISTTSIGSPVWLVVESISNPAVAVANASGTTSEGKSYIDLSNVLGDGNLSPKEKVIAQVRFQNPKKVAFTFKPSVYGVILN